LQINTNNLPIPHHTDIRPTGEGPPRIRRKPRRVRDNEKQSTSRGLEELRASEEEQNWYNKHFPQCMIQQSTGPSIKEGEHNLLRRKKEEKPSSMISFIQDIVCSVLLVPNSSLRINAI
jgi:hypothetical protein